MSRLVRHLVEPKRILLAWQPPTNVPYRVPYPLLPPFPHYDDDPYRAPPYHTLYSVSERLVVGEVMRRRFSDIEFRYLPRGEDFEKAVALGFEGHPAFPLGDFYSSPELLSVFMKRLPPRHRADYNQFLLSHNLDPRHRFSPMALLGYTGAFLPGDGFSFVHPFDDTPPPFEFMGEVQGLYPTSQTITPDQLVEGQEGWLQVVDGPPYSPTEIYFTLPNGEPLGLVDRLQVPSLLHWVNSPGVRATLIQAYPSHGRVHARGHLEVGRYAGTGGGGHDMECAMSVQEQLEKIGGIQFGWLPHGEGEGFSAEKVAWLIAAFAQHYPASLPVPYLYPAPDGGVKAEWAEGDFTLEVGVNNKVGFWRDGMSEEGGVLNLASPMAWEWMVREIRDLMEGANG